MIFPDLPQKATIPTIGIDPIKFLKTPSFVGTSLQRG
jgi:hypothetical protein